MVVSLGQCQKIGQDSHIYLITNRSRELTQTQGERYVTLLFLGVFALMFVYVIAISFPGLLVHISNSPLGSNLNVASNVDLSFGNKIVVWPPGTYGPCYVTSSYSDCVQTNSNTSNFAGLSVLVALMAVVTAILILVAFMRRISNP